MEQVVLDHLQSERVCSLAVLLPDGSPHAAAMHFSHLPDLLTIYIQTENTSKKFTALASGQRVAAAVVVGFDEKSMVTLQLDGQIQWVSDKSALPTIHRVHYAKHPEAEKYKSDPGTVFLAFTPRWWRYTDYKTQPPTIISGANPL